MASFPRLPTDPLEEIAAHPGFSHYSYRQAYLTQRETATTDLDEATRQKDLMERHGVLGILECERPASRAKVERYKGLQARALYLQEDIRLLNLKLTTEEEEAVARSPGDGAPTIVAGNVQLTERARHQGLRERCPGGESVFRILYLLEMRRIQRCRASQERRGLPLPCVCPRLAPTSLRSPANEGVHCRKTSRITR